MSEENKYTFKEYYGHDFQEKLIWQLLVEPEFASETLERISVEYFDDVYMKKFFIIMLEYYNEFDKVPNLQNKSIYEALQMYKSPNNPTETEVLLGKLGKIEMFNEKIINKNQLYDGDVVRKNTYNFIRQQEIRKIGEQVISETQKGNTTKDIKRYGTGLMEKISNVMEIGEDENYGTDVSENIEDALTREFRETIPTGIEVIDRITDNGLGKGETGLILAPSGTGKSTMLTKIANTAYNNKKKVLQIFFEDTTPEIRRKHFAIWSGVPLSKMYEKSDYVKEKVEIVTSRINALGGKIDLLKLNQEDTTIRSIREWIRRQEKKFGYKYDMIIIDYLDCLEPNFRTADLLSAELSVIKSFEAMASDLDVPCWSAIQANRGGYGAEFVDAHNTGGNIKRLQKSHFVMSISKPDKDANSNLANLKIIKARFAQDGQEFKHCIFNNDTLEIRVTDDKYTKDIKTKVYDSDSEYRSIQNKLKKLDSDGIHHDVISQKFDELGDYESEETVGSAADGLKLNGNFLKKKDDIVQNLETISEDNIKITSEDNIKITSEDNKISEEQKNKKSDDKIGIVEKNIKEDNLLELNEEKERPNQVNKEVNVEKDISPPVKVDSVKIPPKIDPENEYFNFIGNGEDEFYFNVDDENDYYDINKYLSDDIKISSEENVKTISEDTNITSEENKSNESVELKEENNNFGESEDEIEVNDNKFGESDGKIIGSVDEILKYISADIEEKKIEDEFDLKIKKNRKEFKDILKE